METNMSFGSLSIHTMSDSERSESREAKNVPNNDNIDYDTVPMRAINSSTRLKLSQLLNVQQALTNTKNVARDYRGLAELMGFEYIDIRNFERCKDPTKEIIEEWEVKPHSSVGALIKILDDLERYDILDEIQPLVSENVKIWLRKRQENSNYSNEQTTYNRDDSSFNNTNFRAQFRQPQPYPPDVIHPLSAKDDSTNENFYDAYVCYSDMDLDFVQQLSERLEIKEIGLKLFIRERDLALGVLEYDAYFRLIEERCKRVLVILSPDFFQSAECEFQAKFAAGLGIDQRCNKIIPIVYKPCSIPTMLSCLSKVDFTRCNDYNFKWNWEKLIRSLGGKVVQTVRNENSSLAIAGFSTIPSNPPDVLPISNFTPEVFTPSSSGIVSTPTQLTLSNNVVALPRTESAESKSYNHKKTKSSKPKWLTTMMTKVTSGFNPKGKSSKTKFSSN